ncbi:UDP-N-acetyl-D-mannosamine dehydrogenase [Thalassomonas viridans]|uniref:UDP-N-acetyl-D-mannosamine dehydrogenase n=1 Tax=Thalassomonas viridans TaxID=137584 RepID=A0AAF0C881_9GAMM|nr:UDP-N-acetyl-D-mannosamine dehydrogenase [Thalassomonas viridans]WDE03930.1 UDP-N-acetyl-D-mannosamine dehydrogenase [Thalassomonas viridans]
MSFETISVIGLGYIGLPTAAMFASRKVNVIGVDVNAHAVDTINRGEIHIVEPELDMLVHASVNQGYLRAALVPEPADAFLIAVPTPFAASDESGSHHQPDLTYIESATRAVAKVIKKGDLVILESTSPVGATELMAQWLSEERPDLTFPQDVGSNADVNIAHCPERVLPGHVVRELVENDRVIGGMSPRCSERATQLYKTFVQGECIITNARTAEMAKLTENASRDVSIAFANELSLICDRLDINVWELIALANRHPRVNILQPGPGVGGHCIAVDPWFIVAKTPEQARLISTAREINDGKPKWVIEKVKLALAEHLASQANKTSKEISIACLGLVFKPDIDDLRESPALGITQDIRQWFEGELLVVEPNITELPASLAEHASLVPLEQAVVKADIIVVLVNHKEFRQLRDMDLDKILCIDTIGLVS